MKPIHVVLTTLVILGVGILGFGIRSLYMATFKKSGDIADIYVGWFGILLSVIGGSFLVIALIVGLVDRGNKHRQ